MSVMYSSIALTLPHCEFNVLLLILPGVHDGLLLILLMQHEKMTVAVPCCSSLHVHAVQSQMLYDVEHKAEEKSVREKVHHSTEVR